mmetsp:Transcript_1212/g.2209  ORF Transcript_1212/g.2209 Transcript_1212/m.2209 type:complete len:345 (+) Transcript_1212:688-1722(+)
MLTGAINSFPALCFMRVIHGSFNSATNPVAYSLVTDYVPPESRSTANSLLSSGVYIGIALSSLTILIIKEFGWRNAYLFSGVVGVLTGLATLLLVREPKRGAFMNFAQREERKEHERQDKIERQKMSFAQKAKSALFDIWDFPTAKWVTIAASLRSFGGMATATFLPVFIQKAFPMFKSEYAVANAIALSVFGFTSSLLGGIISDRLEHKNLMTKAIICCVGSFLAGPLMAFICLNTSSFWMTMGVLCVKILVSGSYTSPAITMMQNTSNSRTQGNLISAHFFYTTLASTISPAVLGYLSTVLDAPSNPMIYGRIILAFVLTGYVGSVPFFWKAGLHYKEFMLE